MTLDIIVPQYNESEEVIKNLLDSIEFQLNKDQYEFQVIIINDGSKTWLSKKFLSQYSFKLRYIKRPHLGVSQTRQYGVDISIADFVMFCDSDDFFTDRAAFYYIFNALKPDIDIINPPLFISDLDNNIDYIDLRDHYDIDMFNGVAHGRVYNRLFLVNHNIKWEPKLAMNEDLYFNTCAAICRPNIYNIPQVYYMWTFNKSSVTQINEYGGKNFAANFDFYYLLIDLLLQAEYKLPAYKYLGMIIQTIYLIIQHKVAQENTSQVLAKFKKFIKKYKTTYLEITTEDRLKYIKLEVLNIKDKAPITDDIAEKIDKWALNLIKAD